MSKLIITKDLNNKIIFGPSTSIINELNDKKKDEKKYIFQIIVASVERILTIKK